MQAVESTPSKDGRKASDCDLPSPGCSRDAPGLPSECLVLALTGRQRPVVQGQPTARLLPSPPPRLDAPARQGLGRLGRSAALEVKAGLWGDGQQPGLAGPGSPALSSARRAKEPATVGPGPWAVSGITRAACEGAGAGLRPHFVHLGTSQAWFLQAGWPMSVGRGQCYQCYPGSLSPGWEGWIVSLFGVAAGKGGDQKQPHLPKPFFTARRPGQEGGRPAPSFEAAQRSGWRPERAGQRSRGQAAGTGGILGGVWMTVA